MEKYVSQTESSEDTKTKNSFDLVELVQFSLGLEF